MYDTLKGAPILNYLFLDPKSLIKKNQKNIMTSEEKTLKRELVYRFVSLFKCSLSIRKEWAKHLCI